jgi:hypothetical protein
MAVTAVRARMDEEGTPSDSHARAATSNRNMALPGLEPGPDGSVEGRPAPSADAPAEIPGAYVEGAGEPMAVEGRLRPRACSNVARALRGLLEHARRAGLDPAHPTVRAAEAALEEDGAHR